MMTVKSIVAALEFASPAMLGWLAAAALPILVNLWTRRRHLETPWAAVNLLLAAVQERSRRLRLREWLLLAMRCAILLLAALAAARPSWRQGATAGPASARTHHILIIDQSFSMTRVMDDATPFDRAKNRAARIVETSPAGDAFTVIAWSDEAENVLGRATFDSAAALAAIDQLRPADTPARLSSAIRAAQSVVDAARSAFPEISRYRTIFFTDLAPNTWNSVLTPPPGSHPTDDADAAQLVSQWNDLATSTEVIVDSPPGGASDNVAIHELRLLPLSPAPDQSAAVEVHLSSYGGASWEDLRVELLADGIPIGAQQAAAKPGDLTVVRFPVRLSEPGGHILEARLAAPGDPLTVDNKRWLSADVRQQSRVVCFADDAADALEVARGLNPRFREPASEARIAVTIEPTNSLSRTSLEDYDAIVLANVSTLSPREQRLLRRYVAGGGALLIVVGDQTSPLAFNEFIGRQPGETGQLAEPLLPLSLLRLTGPGQWRLDPLGYRHPTLAAFEGQPRAGLLDVRVSNYFPAEVTDEKRAQVALAFTSGDPALVTADFGRGRTAVLLTSPVLAANDASPWSTFAVNPSWVPLLRELLDYLSIERRAAQLNCLAGQDLSEPQSPGEWRTPTGELVPRPPRTLASGVYTFTPADSARDGGKIVQFAVNVDPSESDLTSISPSELLRDTPSASAAPSAGLPGSEPLARQLLFAAGALLLVELTMAWAFGRGAA